MHGNGKRTLQDKYIALFGAEPVDNSTLDEIEKVLKVALPGDFRHIASFYAGGLLGGISHHAIANGGPAANLVDETLRLRSAIGLPLEFLVLAEPAEGFIVLHTATGRVTWCDAQAVYEVCEGSTPPNVDEWPSYSEFFGYLIQEQETG